MVNLGLKRKRLPFEAGEVHTDDVIDSAPDGAKFGAVTVDLDLKNDRQEAEIKDTYPYVNDKQHWATFGGQLAFEVIGAAHHGRDEEPYPNPVYERYSKRRYTDWMNPVYINRSFNWYTAEALQKKFGS